MLGTELVELGSRLLVDDVQAVGDRLGPELVAQRDRPLGPVRRDDEQDVRLVVTAAQDPAARMSLCGGIGGIAEQGGTCRETAREGLVGELVETVRQRRATFCQRREAAEAERDVQPR